jgi:spore germination protein YaaH
MRILPELVPNTPTPERTKSVMPKGPKRVPWPVLILAALILLIVGTVIYPSFQYVELPMDSRPYLVHQGEIQKFPVVVEKREAYVPLRFIQDKLDPHVHWDESGVMVVTTRDKVVKLRTQSLTAYVNQHPVSLQFPVILDGKEPYVPASTLETLYPVSTHYSQEYGIFLVRSLDIPRTVGEIRTGTILRTKASPLARRVRMLPAGEQVVVYGDGTRWLKVETSSGLCGFVLKRHVSELRQEPPAAQQPSDYVPSPLKGDKVVLVWEQVDRITPDPSSLGEMPGLNVVSPTWFHLADIPGEVENRADMRYVNWAHSRGYQVWALFSNSFDPERTSVVLRDSALRDKVISQLLIYADVYKLDGINVDFENVYLADGPYLTQFMRELTPLLHSQGLTVSIDITVRSTSPNWSLFLERDKLAQVVDYVMLMAYDQYPHGSKVSGPVSTIPWTEWTITTTLEEVPKDKLVLGVPFYTRLWKETRENGQTTVTPRALGMEGIALWLKDENVTPEYQADTGLLYAEKKAGNVTYKVWLEDVQSMKKRIDLVNKYDLAGVAAWRRGFETPDIWEVICENLGS